jgi:hypothetical protein
MANPFDQFDTAPTVGNPFDQFDAKVAPKKAPDSVLSRVMTGLADPVVGAGRVMDKLVNPIRQAISPGASTMEDVIKQREGQYTAPEGVDWARMGGNVANPISWAGGGKGVVQAIGQGAMQSAISPEGEGGLMDIAKRAVTGGALGGTVSKLLGGAKGTEEARKLMDQGIQPTVGQSIGGIANNLEQKWTSLPIVGEAISDSRKRAAKEFEQAALERVTGFPARTVADANATASQAFDKVVPYLTPHPEAVIGIQQSVTDAVKNPRLTSEYRDTLKGLRDEYVANFSQNTGEDLKKLDSQIGYDIRKYASGDQNARELSRSLQDLQQQFRAGLEAGGSRAAAGAAQGSQHHVPQPDPIQ